MSHYTEGVLQAYLDREVPEDTRASVDAHVTGCRACAARLQELRDLSSAVENALKLVDAPPAGRLTAAELRERARWRGRFALPARRALARAALFVVGISAAAAAAVPGSPVNDWVRGVWQQLTADDAAQAPAPEPAARSAPRSEPAAISILPSDGRIQVALQDLADETTVQVALVDSERATVEVGDGAFRTAAGRIEVLRGTGAVRVMVPRLARDAVLEIDGEVYVRRVGEELRLVSRNAEKIPGAELTFRPRR